MLELLQEWREHLEVPSNVGHHPDSRPEWVGAKPSLIDRRAYMRSYLRWANNHSRDWDKVNRGPAEELTARVYAKDGFKDIGKHRWECLVDATLWNMSFGSIRPAPAKIPEFPWDETSDTDGGPSPIYRTLSRKYLAEVGGLPARQVEASLETKDGQKLKALTPKAQAEPMFGGGRGRGTSAKTRGGMAPRGGMASRGGHQQHNAAAGPSGAKGPGSTKGPISKPHLAARQPPLVEAKTPPPLVNAISNNARMSFAALACPTPAPDTKGKGVQRKSWADCHEDEDDDTVLAGLMSSMHAPGNRPGAKEIVKDDKPKAEAPVVKVTPEVKRPSGAVTKQTKPPSTVVKEPEKAEKPKAENKAMAKEEKPKAEVKEEKKPKANVEPASPKKQTGVAIWEHEGKLYWQPPGDAPDREIRECLYESLCFGGESASKNPFELELPGSFDMEGLVWGEYGADWEYIQDSFVSGDVKLTWGYKGGIPEEAVPFNGEMDKSRMADVGYLLTVGRGQLGACTEDDSKVLNIWRIIRQWYNLCRKSNPKPIKLLFHDFSMDDRRQASLAIKPLPIDYQGIQASVVCERRLRTAQIKEIVDEGGDNVGSSLEKWLIETSAGSSLSKVDRVEMATFEWYADATDKDELDGITVEKWRMAMLAKLLK